MQAYAGLFKVFAADITLTVFRMLYNPTTLQTLGHRPTVRTAVSIFAGVENVQLTAIDPNRLALHHRRIVWHRITPD